MNRNLSPSLRRDVVQRPLALEPRKHPFYREALHPKSLVPWEAGLNPFLSQQFLAISMLALPSRMGHMLPR